MTLRIVTIGAAAAAMALLIAQFLHHPTDTPPRASGRTTPTATAHWRSMQVAIPRNWSELRRTPQYAAWTDASRMHTVTLGNAPIADGDLSTILDGAARALELHLPKARVSSVRATGSRGEIRLTTHAQGHMLYITQSWHRDARAGYDQIATWTSADGTWPIPPIAPQNHRSS